MRISIAGAVLITAVGCSEDRGSRDMFGTGVTAGSSSATGADGSASATGATGADGGEGGNSTGGTSGGGDGDTGGGDGVKFDIGGGPDLAGKPDGSGEGCKKVDFLFVIDNSGSMEDEQQSLVNSFPGFIAEIEDTVETNDFHILVTDSDADATSSGCPGSPGDPNQCAGWCATCPQHCSCVCAGTACPPQPPSCDYVLGAGQVKDQDLLDCGVVGGQRYMTQDQPDLNGTFGCVALVGTGGDGNERPMEAAMEAVSSLVVSGECNEGFLRDDAILVVTVISDEEDFGKSVGDPGMWKQSLVTAKNGDETAVVALAVVGDTDLPGGVCSADAEGAPRLRQWADSFTHGQWGSVCAADYTPFFHDAVSVIDTACDDFVPPG